MAEAGILVINGPNLGRLGTREPSIYGTATQDDLIAALRADAGDVPVALVQSEHEGTLVEHLHGAADAGTPVILNAGALTHYSIALHDAVALVVERGVPVIEVHLSNPHAREEFRHTSVLSAVVSGVIAGFGVDSYRLALAQLLRGRAA